MLLVVMLLLQTLLSVGQPPEEGPATLPGYIHSSASGSCSSQQNLDTITNQILHNISATLSCGGQGWRRVGYLDMTDPSQSCPPGLALKYYSPGLRSCGRATNDSAGCWSTFYTTDTSQYSRVCGRVRGYQFGSTSAFSGIPPGGGGPRIDAVYLDGVSLTHGHNSSREHIWTFAAGLSYVYNVQYFPQFCPCVATNAAQPPAFVGNDYFCESGLNTAWVDGEYIFYPADPLWDGQNCGASTCCQFNNLPYFTKTLPAPITDDIELRICSWFPATLGDTPIDQVELYVQ